MCKCKNIGSAQALSTDYFKNVGGKDMAVYATIQPTQDTAVPYWCKTTSAYDDANPTGYISLKDPVFAKALPVQAKHSLRLLIDDLNDGTKKPLDYYGTVLNIGGKVVKYDPNLMTGQVQMIPKEEFLQDAGAGSETGSGTLNTDNAPASGNILDQAKAVAEEHPLAITGGLLLMLFGIATVISSK